MTKILNYKFGSAFLALCSLVFILVSCSGKGTINQSNNDPTGYHKLDSLVLAENFADTVDGVPIGLYTLRNSQGVVVKLTNYGARIVSVLTPDTAGNYADITLGYRSIAEYLADPMYLGCIVGRYANRIAKGQFEIDGKKYHLFINNGKNSLHGGKKGFGQVAWQAAQNGNEVVFNYTSEDMEEGYPGNLKVSVRYFLTDTNTLGIAYTASTDKKTVLNLTNHAYFNLSGEGSGDILKHEIMLNASRFLPVDSTLIPTGVLEPVAGTPFDLQTSLAIGTHIGESHEQLVAGKGYDHCWVLEPGQKSGEPVLAARVTDPASGRGMELWTSEPGLQFYSGNFMDGKVSGKAGVAYQFRNGFALEPQHFPDSPNQANFPGTLLMPGKEYKQLSIFYFFNK